MIKILVTNDDGVNAKGIKALAQALKKVKGVKVTVVAPGTEQSSTSHSITLHRPLRIKKISTDVFSVDGTPIDAVFVGVWVILKEKPDFIFSGINRGGNLGEDVHYSGTVSAAVEGGIMGVPSVAISQLGIEKVDFSVAAKFSVKFHRLLKKHPLPKGMVLNVNLPEKAKLSQFEVTKVGQRNYGGKFSKQKDPRGGDYYWIGGDQYKFLDIKGSDCNAIMANKISVSPIQVDMTSHQYIKTIQNWLKKK